MDEIVERTAAVLEGGGTILYPTDTIWGLGCDAGCTAAVERLYRTKERDTGKSMLVLMAEEDWMKEENEIYNLLIARGRPTTVILPAAMLEEHGVRIAGNLVAQDGTIGVRLPQQEFCQRLLDRTGMAIVSTSANMSGRPSPACYADIDDELKQRVDYCVPECAEGKKEVARASRIVKIAGDGTIKTIRE